MNTKKNKFSERTSKTFQCYGILSTQLIGFVLFSLYPMLWAMHKAFFYYDGTPSLTHFVGLDNFIKIFTTDAAYWKTWAHTFMFAVGKLPIELPFAMLIAVCLRSKIKGTGFFRTMYYLPCVIGAAIVGLIITNMFDYFGFINAWLLRLGIIKKNIAWFSNTGTAWAALIIGAVWNTFGTNVLYFLAAMSNIPEELYESARLEGASPWKAFVNITLPMMSPVLQTILLLSLNGTIQTSDYILTTTNGAPAGSTYTVMSYIVGKFVPGFAETNVNIGYGCAMAMLTSIGMIIIAIIYTKLTKHMQELY